MTAHLMGRRQNEAARELYAVDLLPGESLEDAQSFLRGLESCWRMTGFETFTTTIS